SNRARAEQLVRSSSPRFHGNSRKPFATKNHVVKHQPHHSGLDIVRRFLWGRSCQVAFINPHFRAAACLKPVASYRLLSCGYFFGVRRLASHFLAATRSLARRMFSWSMRSTTRPFFVTCLTTSPVAPSAISRTCSKEPLAFGRLSTSR